MNIARRSAVAGLFYPDDPRELRVQVQSYIDGATAEASTSGGLPSPKAIIAPHAGYVYSGPIAGSAYARIAAGAEQITRVILFGPAHRMAFQGIAYSRAEHFETPLGDIPVDRAALEQIGDLPEVHARDAAFDGEHCLEVQLPFLQVLLGAFRVVPLLVGDARDEAVTRVMERLWGGPETLIVVSSDLSHYLDDASARSIDARTAQAICALQPEAITHHQACGRNPIAGLLLAARHHGLKASVLDLRNSGDTAGPRDRVVGYGAYAFE